MQKNEDEKLELKPVSQWLEFPDISVGRIIGVAAVAFTWLLLTTYWDKFF